MGGLGYESAEDLEGGRRGEKWLPWCGEKGRDERDDEGGEERRGTYSTHPVANHKYETIMFALILRTFSIQRPKTRPVLLYTINHRPITN